VFTAMLLLGTGLVILVFGAELLVRGAARLAAGLGIPALVIGLTVVAFGTSAPELAVSIKSAFAGQADIALGNVVGSNIFNVLFILGLAALITPLVVSQQLVRLDVPLMIAVSVLVLLLGLDGHLGRLDGALLFGGLIGYTLFLVRQSRRESAAVQAEYAQEYGTPGPPDRSAVAGEPGPGAGRPGPAGGGIALAGGRRRGHRAAVRRQ
jgi:cation:H+ antiporter